MLKMSDKIEKIRVQVLFTQEQYDIIQKLKGELGLTNSEVIRNIVVNWLLEKSFISTSLKSKFNINNKNYNF